jgi:hypothetical protein
VESGESSPLTNTPHGHDDAQTEVARWSHLKRLDRLHKAGERPPLDLEQIRAKLNRSSAAIMSSRATTGHPTREPMTKAEADPSWSPSNMESQLQTAKRASKARKKRQV